MKQIWIFQTKSMLKHYILKIIIEKNPDVIEKKLRSDLDSAGQITLESAKKSQTAKMSQTSVVSSYLQQYVKVSTRDKYTQRYEKIHLA